MSLASEICKKAAKIIDGDREAQHGVKERNFDNIAWYDSNEQSS